MGSVHGSWTTGTPVNSGLASIAGWWSSSEPSLQPFWDSRPTAKGCRRLGDGLWRLGDERRVVGPAGRWARGEGARWVGLDSGKKKGKSI
jgi:hypothetical protein